MKTYMIIEAGMRDGYAVEVSSLAAAKRIASRKQLFQQTVLKITDRGAVVATKENGKWKAA